MLHHLAHLLGNDLVEELVDLLLFFEEVFIAQVVLFHEIRQLILFLLQLVPLVLNLLLFLQKLLHLLLVRPVQFLLLEQVLQHLLYLVLQLVGLLCLLFEAVHDVFRGVVGNAVQGGLRGLVVGKGLRALRLGSVETVVVPHLEIHLHILSGQDAQAVHVEAVEERRAGLLEVDGYTLDDVLLNGFLHLAVEGQLAEAVVVGN